jgi:hypothetical protein
LNQRIRRDRQCPGQAEPAATNHGYSVPKGAQSHVADRAALTTRATRHWQPVGVGDLRESDMAKGEQKGNREAKKPKKEKIKTIAAAPSQKTAGWQPSFASGKKK